uniref:Secreted protein n=1 Tax=Ascaris lumbricoides TaxID=6252 RepID=A0A0M3IT59_ASCLU
MQKACSLFFQISACIFRTEWENTFRALKKESAELQKFVQIFCLFLLFLNSGWLCFEVLMRENIQLSHTLRLLHKQCSVIRQTLVCTDVQQASNRAKCNFIVRERNSANFQHMLQFFTCDLYISWLKVNENKR